MAVDDICGTQINETKLALNCDNKTHSGQT